MGNSKPGKKGAVLIVVLGVLAILALLATTFATLQRIERVVARNYLDAVRARLIARSGIDHAIQRLSTDGVTPLQGIGGERPMAYWGNDLLETGANPALVPVPLREAANPSYAVETDGDPVTGGPQPAQLTIQGTPSGYSGAMLSGTYGRHGDQYALRVSDAASKIWINQGLKEYGGRDSYGSRNLERMLNHLGAMDSVAVGGLGTLILDNRPSLGYTALDELLHVVGSDELERLRHFLTTQAWTEETANPVPFSQRQADNTEALFGIRTWRGETTPLYRYGRGNNHQGTAMAGHPVEVYSSTDTVNNTAANGNAFGVYGLDELNPVWIERAPRAPVNINTASREIITALLCDLHGVFLADRRRNSPSATVKEDDGGYAGYIGGGYDFILSFQTYDPEEANWPAGTRYSTVREHSTQEGDEIGFLYETPPLLPPPSGGSGPFQANRADIIADEILACRDRLTSPHGRTLGPTDPGWVGSYDDPSQSEHVAHLDYASAPFGGPFRTWRQFNAFCDNLVRIGILEDDRPIYFNHDCSWYTTANWVDDPCTGYDPDPPYSRHQASVACRAMADVLKANFNPNLHLNELNPDRNLFLHVDKTDLVVNSTEFCFLPTGFFDIDSVGRLLSPEGGDDCLTAANNLIMAEAEVHAGVKIFELVRNSTQQEFQTGTITPCSCGVQASTNNGLSLETGPEPGTGDAPQQNDWSGYLAFPTCGGPSSSHFAAETIVAHLATSFDADHHAAGITADLGSTTVAGEEVWNAPDPTESISGPYDPGDGVPAADGQRFRLARSFSLAGLSGTGSLPPIDSQIHAPLDFRIDGGYLERHAGLAYWLDKNVYYNEQDQFHGSLWFWVKPSFFPEQTGKPRFLCNMNPIWTNPTSPSFRFNITGMGHWLLLFAPSHHRLPADYTAGGVPSLELNEFGLQWGEVGPHGCIPIRPASLVFGTGWGKWNLETNYRTIPPARVSGDAYYQYTVSPTLNHKWHYHDPAGSPTVMKGHEWMHVALKWETLWDETFMNEERNYAQPNTGLDANGEGAYRIYINNQLFSHPIYSRHDYCGKYPRQTVMPHPDAVFTDDPALYDPPEARDPITWKSDGMGWFNHRDGSQNSLRFGSPTRLWGGTSIYDPAWIHGTLNNSLVREYNIFHAINYPADSTIDEIHFCPDNIGSRWVNNYLEGRYHIPFGSDECVFTSAELTPSSCQRRNLPPPTAQNPPVATGGTPLTVPKSDVPPVSGATRLLGVAWTAYGDGTIHPDSQDWSPDPTLRDWSAGDFLHVPTASDVLFPEIGVSVPGAGTIVAYDDGYTPLLTTTGTAVDIDPTLSLQYEIRIRLPGSDISTILMSTPVVDDVTFYVNCGHVHYTYYYQVNLAI